MCIRDRINTIGGDVECGLAIAELIASLSKPTVSLVLGGSHLIGVPPMRKCDLGGVGMASAVKDELPFNPANGGNTFQRPVEFVVAVRCV